MLFKIQRNEEARDLTTMGSNVDHTESPKIVMKEKRLIISWEMFFLMVGRGLERYILFLGHVRKVEKHFQQKDSFGSGELKEQAQSDEKDVTDRKISDVS